MRNQLSYLQDSSRSTHSTKTNCYTFQNNNVLKQTRTILFSSIVFALMFSSCRAGKGCPSDGRNVGAEKILAENPRDKKLLRKAKKAKYKLNKF